MRKLIFLWGISLLVFSCGAPSLSSVDPPTAAPHQLVSLSGDQLLAKVLWYAPGGGPADTLPGFVFGGGPITVPDDAAPGVHQISLYRDGVESPKQNITILDAATYAIPGPKFYYFCTPFPSGIGIDSVGFNLMVQGANMDAGATIRVNGTDYSSKVWKAYSVDHYGMDQSFSNNPQRHWIMNTAYIRAEIGEVLNISVVNDGGAVSVAKNWTVPAIAEWDSDQDGLLDDWEDNGHDVDGDGTVDVSYHLMGADKLIFDIFTEVDYMDGANAGAADKVPAGDPWTAVEDAFFNAPLINVWGGLTGIQLHIDRGQATYTDISGVVHNIPAAERQGGTIVPYATYIRMDGDPAPFEAAGETTNNFYDIKNNVILTGGATSNFDITNRNSVWHYSLFANSHGHSPNSSGRGEINGNDFFMCLSDFRLSGFPQVVAGTYMHELGHNLGLDHSGETTSPDNEPNHLSVMSYFSFDGSFVGAFQNSIDTTCDRVPDNWLDYSYGINNAISEASVNEADGVCNGVAIDFDGDGNDAEVGITTDANNDGDSVDNLTDHENWGNIIFIFNNND